MNSPTHKPPHPPQPPKSTLESLEKRVVALEAALAHTRDKPAEPKPEQAGRSVFQE